MATFPLPPAILFGTAANDNTAGAGDETVAKGILTLAGLGQTIPLKDILGYTNTVYAAGTAQVTTLALAAATVTAGVRLNITVTRLDTLAQTNYTYLMVTGETTTTLRTALALLINNQQGGFVTGGGSSTNLTLTEVGNVGGFTVSFTDSGITQSTGTAHVNSSGTLAEVQQYVPTAAGSQYRKYDFFIRKLINQNQGQAFVWAEGHVVYWLESLDAQAAAFNTALTADLDATVITAAADTIPFLATI